MSSNSAEGPQPQPEQGEPRLHDPGLTSLSGRDYAAILKRAGRESLADGITDAAAALAYYAFLALPSVLLVAVGVFGLTAGPGAVDTIVERLSSVAPQEAVDLLSSSLRRITETQASSVTLVAIGFLLAFWTTTSAMTALMRALNRIYNRGETRGFVKQRISALTMLCLVGAAVLLVLGLLVLGPHLAHWIGRAAHLESTVSWIWWTAQWPVLVLGLLLAFWALLWLGPDVKHPKARFLTPGAALAVFVWLAASGLFALYVSMFGSYNKTWGTLAAVVITLTWLWISGLALLFGAEVNAETERSRELRQGKPAQRRLVAPAKAAPDS